MLVPKGMDNIKKRIEEMKKPEFLKKALIDKICEKVPEAAAYKNKFKIDKLANGKFEIKAEGLLPELHNKITKAMSTK